MDVKEQRHYFTALCLYRWFSTLLILPYLYTYFECYGIIFWCYGNAAVHIMNKKVPKDTDRNSEITHMVNN